MSTRIVPVKILFIALTVLLVGLGTAAAQTGIDETQNPAYGADTLEAGFIPDPYILTMLSGGPNNAATLNLGAGCVGFVATAPDFRIFWEGQTNALRFYYVSGGDTTIVVRDPQGRFACNDDFEGLNPLVEFANPAAGAYNIWVGSYAQDEYIPGYLMITEGPSSPANLVSSLLVSSGQQAPLIPDQPTPAAPAAIEGLQHFPNLSIQHVQTPVRYAQNPPAGGEHWPVWQNCGVYRQPVRNEQAVHALEHGAVWITYQPNLPADQISLLESMVSGQSHLLLSPYPGLPSPVVASAWGYQLQLDSASDPRLSQFIAQFQQGPTTPEPGAPCSGGDGDPLDR